MRVRLRDIAHARAGDKGNTSNISVWPYDVEHYGLLKAQLTAEFVMSALSGVVRGPVQRYELEGLKGFNFVLHEALEGGVNSSLNLDSHGKSWSFLMLELEVDLAGARDD